MYTFVYVFTSRSAMADIKMPEKVTEYLKSGVKKIVKVIPGEDYSLKVFFDNGEIRMYDMKDMLFGVFEILKDEKKFREVFIDGSGNIAWDKDKNVDSNIEWNNRIDLCKDSVYMDSVPAEK